MILIVAASQVSSLPLGNNFERDLTGGLLDEVSGGSLGLPGGDLFSGLLDGTALGESEDVTSSLLEDLLDPSTLDLVKREPLGDLTDRWAKRPGLVLVFPALQTKTCSRH